MTASANHRRVVRTRACALVLLGLAVWSPRVTAGEPQGRAGTPTPTQLQASPDFLLGAPRAFLGLRGSLVVPRAGGELFAFVTDQLTLDRSGFRSRGFAADAGLVLTPILDVVAGFDLTRRTAVSEYRRFVTAGRNPIEQATALEQTSLSAGVRVSPFGRGRRVSRYAYIPRRVAPYAGAGLTATRYSFSQRGQFVDFTDNSIFTDRFASEGWAAGPYVNGGVDLQAWKRLYLTIDGRYSWLHGALGSDFSGFDGIDLTGVRLGTGLSVVF